MFNKLYKEANDEIRVNTLLLENLKSEASKGEKRKSYSFMYKYGFAAAAVLIVTVSLNIMPDIKRNQGTENRYPGTEENIVLNDTTAKHDETSESLTKEENEKYKNNNISTDDNTSLTNSNDNIINSKKITQNNSSASHKTAITHDNITPVEEPVKSFDINPSPAPESSDSGITSTSAEDVKKEESTTPEVEIFSAIPENNEPAVPEISARSGGGGTMYRQYSPFDSETLISSEEYFSLFGFNPDSWNIPEDMTITEGEEVYIAKNSETGEYAKTSHTIIYSGNNKTIYMTLFPNDSDILSLINSGNGELYNDNLILKNTDSSYTSYIVKNGNGYIVETNNLEKEHVYSLIDSIG